MTPGLIVLALVATLVLLLVTISTLQSDASYRTQMLASVDTAASTRRPFLRALDDRLRRTGPGSRLAALLAGSGLVTWSPAGFILSVAGLAVAAGLLALPVLGRLGALVIAVAVVASAKRWLDKRRQARIERFVAQLPEMARLLANGAQAGLAVRRSIELAAREMAEPAASELSQVSSELAVGRTLDSALGSLAVRLPSRELVVLVQTLVIQRTAGGALVTALSNIAGTLEERRQLRREIKTATTGAAFSGYVVIIIGVGSVILMNLLSPGALDQMLGSVFGQIALIVAGVLFVLGYLLIRRFSRVEL